MPSAAGPFSLPPLASHPLFLSAHPSRSDALPRLAMPLPQRAVPVDESDSELDSAGTEPTDPFLPHATYPPSAPVPGSALIFDEHGELARVQSPPDGARAFAARPGTRSLSPSWPWSLWGNRAATLPAAPAAGHAPPALFSAASAQIALRIAIIFVVSTAAVVGGLWTLPLHVPAKGITHLTIGEIRSISLALQEYATHSLSAAVHTWVVLLAFFTWKQAWSVPGSVVSNVLLGMIYGTYLATLYTSFFTATGGVLCYLLARPVGPIIEHLPGFQKPLDAMRRALSLPQHTQAYHPISQTDPVQPTAPLDAKKFTPVVPQQPSMPSGSTAPHSTSSTKQQGMSTWTYLLFLRLVPIVPWSAMNICCAVLDVPLAPFWASFLLGSVPWNFVTTQVGDILQDILAALPPEDQNAGSGGEPPVSGLSTIKAKIWSKEMVLKLTLLTLASLLPMALQWWVKRRRNSSFSASANAQPYDLPSLGLADAASSSSDLDVDAFTAAGVGAGGADDGSTRASSSLLSWVGRPHRRTHDAVHLLSSNPKAFPLSSSSPSSGGWADTIRTPSPFGQLLRLASLTPRQDERERDVESSPASEDEPGLDTPTALGSVLVAPSHLPDEAQRAPPPSGAPSSGAKVNMRSGRKHAHLPPLAPLSPRTHKALVDAETDMWGGGPARTPSPMQALKFARDRERAFGLGIGDASRQSAGPLPPASASGPGAGHSGAPRP